jgi:glutaredoxin/glutathione-dependent peroxiredoxin
MAVKSGDRIPSAKFKRLTADGMKEITTDEIFNGKKVMLFSVPGAFTPTCSNKHLPGFVKGSEDLKKKGIDSIVCLAVNDAFVMDAWGKSQNVGDKVLMLADGSGDFTRALGLQLDLRANGLGERGQRFAMVVDNGTIKSLEIDPPGQFEKTSCEVMAKKV